MCLTGEGLALWDSNRPSEACDRFDQLKEQPINRHLATDIHVMSKALR